MSALDLTEHWAISIVIEDGVLIAMDKYGSREYSLDDYTLMHSTTMDTPLVGEYQTYNIADLLLDKYPEVHERLMAMAEEEHNAKSKKNKKLDVTARTRRLQASYTIEEQQPIQVVGNEVLREELNRVMRQEIEGALINAIRHGDTNIAARMQEALRQLGQR